MRLNEILFPTDFSPESQAAGLIAQEVAVRADARLHVLHVVRPVTDPSLAAESLARAARGLTDGLRAEPVLLSGWAGRRIVDYAREKHIACLVLTVPASVLAERGAIPAAPRLAPVSPRRCLVCDETGEDLICESCRTRIRGEALEQKREAERSGRRGLPV